MTEPKDLALREAEFLLYQTEDRRTRVEVRFGGETAWLSLKQMADLFQRNKSVISRHIKNVFEEGELQALDRNAMYMADWIRKLDDCLRLSDRDILTHAGKVSHDAAVAQAELEYERFSRERRELPSPVEHHFEEAIDDVKRLEKKRRSSKQLSERKKPGKSRGGK